MLRLRILGGVEVGDRPVRQAGVRRLLALLAVHPGQVLGADRLVGHVWPSGDRPAHVGAALHSLVARARGVIGDDALVTRAPGYLLDLPPSELDARLFADLVARARDGRGPDGPDGAAALLDRALALWRGPALAEFADEDFARPEIARLDELRAAAQDERVRADLDGGRPQDAVARLGPLVGENPFRERRRELLVLALHRAGRPRDALEAYASYRRLLAEELGLDPGPELRRLEAAVLSRDLVGAPTPAAAPAGSAPPPGRWSTAPALVGRAAAVADVAGLLRDARGVVTLVGPGGVGKTALARTVVAELRREHPDGAVVAELAAVSAEAGVAPLVVSAVPAPAAPALDRDPASQLVDLLSGRRALLVLDNCEHVLRAAADLVALVRAACPGVRVLTTSREPLGVPGEIVRPVAPLSEPDAIALFATRAAEAGADLVVDARNADAVAEACRRLDRLPLALELAAARMRVVSLDELAAYLPARLSFLRSRTAEHRHRTLHAVVDWSYRLLTDPERRLLERLGVFAGTFTLLGAEEIAGEAGGTAGLLADLVDRSLVVAAVDHGPGGRTRYALLETVRAYARDRLDERAETGAIGRLHAERAVAFLRRAGTLTGPRSAERLDAVTAEWDELRAAHGWACEHDPPTAAALVARLADYGEVRMPPELFAWADRVLALGPAPDLGPDAAGVLAVAAAGARFTGGLDRARELLDAASALVGDGRDARYLLYLRGECELFLGDLDACARTTEELRRAADAAGDVRSGGLTRANAAILLAYAGRTAEAVAAADGMAAWWDEVRDPLLRPWVCYVAGEVRTASDPDVALDWMRESLRHARAVGERYATGVALVTATSLGARHGDPASAARLAEETLEHWRGSGNRTHQWVALRHVTELLVRLHRDRVAAEVLGGLVARRSGGTPYGSDADRLAGLRRELADRIGEPALERAAGAGAARDDDALLDLARRALAAIV